MGISAFSAIKTAGGTAGCLDDIIHGNISDGDLATVVDAINNIVYHYTYDSSSAAAESDPTIINPDSNAGNGRWLLTASKHTTFSGPSGTTINEFSTDGTLGGNSDDAVPTEKATKTYIDAQIAGSVYTITVDMADISTAGSVWVVAPYGGNIIAIRSVISKAITVANATITAELEGVLVEDSAVTISHAGSGPGTVDNSAPTGARTVTAGKAIEIISNGGSTTVGSGCRATFTIVIDQ